MSMAGIDISRSDSGQHDDDDLEKDLEDMLDEEPSFNGNAERFPDKNYNSTKSASLEIVGPFPMESNSSKLDSSESYPSSESISTSGAAGVYPSGISSSGLIRSHSVPPATTNVPLSPDNSASSFNGNSSNGGVISKSMSLTAHSKMEYIKEWSVSTFKTTKQFISERFGRGSRTVDLDIEARIEALRDIQRKYSGVLRLARAMTSHFHNVVQTQKALGENFAELAQTSPELQEEFLYNCETQRTLVKNGDILIGALNFFISSVNTLVNKTIEDTLLTVKGYESARLEYDAYRTDYESIETGSKEAANYQLRLQNARRKYEEHKARLNQLRGDVHTKIQFLNENRIKVMHKQLLLFHNAVSAYFSGNASSLEATLKQFSIQLTRPNSDKPSWLE